MKKLRLNLIVGFILSITLIVISLVVIKPIYLLPYDGNIYRSNKSNTKYEYENKYVTKDTDTPVYYNNEISFSKRDGKLTIEVKTYYLKDNTLCQENSKIVYILETGYTAIAIENDSTSKMIDATITFSNDKNKTPSIKSNYNPLDGEEMMLCYKYSNLINARVNKIGLTEIDDHNVLSTPKKIICSILSIFIGFILSFLAYPVILYDKFKENKKLALFSASLTLVLCLSSGFYIFFTLK